MQEDASQIRAEYLEVFDIRGNYIGLEERGKYFKERKKLYAENKDISTQVKRSVALILTSKGRILIQERSHDKDSNPGMYDKSVGGHTMVIDGYKHSGSLDKELANINMSKELLEELSIPSNIVSNHFFNDALGYHIDRMSFVTRIERIMGYESKRTNKDGTIFIQPYITENYIGYYDGTIQFRDKEASGLATRSIGQLQEGMTKYPDRYTEDLKFLIDRYARYLLPLKEFREIFSKDGNQFNV